MTVRILVIDDDQSMCELIAESLETNERHVEWRLHGREALDLIREKEFDVVITDVNLENMSGLDLCRHLAENRPDIPVIMITGFGSMASAVAAIRAGAYDFINKPLDMAALGQAIERAIQHRHRREAVKRLENDVTSPDLGVLALNGQSPAMGAVYNLIRRVAASDTTVLLSGESGTGKEVVARALHEQSSRAQMPFVAINCAAVPAALLESELFGHVRGAFTDAKNTRQGLFEQATDGTLLLDEIGEMPLELQPKLLRVLQERQVRPVGGNTLVPTNARIIAATNRDLEAEVAGRRFREDLFYRLNVVQIHIPPLRARGNDVLVLAEYFVKTFAERMGKTVAGISDAAAQKLRDYDWPGNVRQLENSIERAVALTRQPQVSVDDLPERITRHAGAPAGMGEVQLNHVLTLDRLEQAHITRALRNSNGNKTQAAKVLGVDRRTLYRKLERYHDAARGSGGAAPGGSSSSF
jgi:DNA-binding NtrC family response regulator